MRIDEALVFMEDKLDEQLARFDGYDVKIKRERRYLNSLFREIDKPEKAKFATVTLIFGAEGLEEEKEYCLSVSAEIKRGRVNEEKLNHSAEEFKKYVDKTLAALSSNESAAEALSSLSEEATAEYEKLLEELNQAREKEQKIGAIGTVLVLFGIAILFAVAALS